MMCWGGSSPSSWASGTRRREVPCSANDSRQRKAYRKQAIRCKLARRYDTHMKCDHCDKDASVHEVTVRNGVKIERHLCESCAEQHGIAVHPQHPITDLIKHYVMKQTAGPAAGEQGLTPVVPAAAQPMRASQCTTCKLTFQEFKQHGLLGCPDCYRCFEGQLAPLVERAHDGATAHVGKVPRHHALHLEVDEAATKALREQRLERLRVLRHELEQAVRDERYEAAARVRDELRRVESQPEAAAPLRGEEGTRKKARGKAGGETSSETGAEGDDAGGQA